MTDKPAVRCPYQGLIPYDQSDAPFFFGREEETHLIAANLFASPLTLLYGASGVGKSSILRAGVTHSLSQRDDLLVLVFSTWQGNPLEDLKAAVAKAGQAKISAVYASADRSAVPATADGASVPSQQQSESLLAFLTDWSAKLNRHLLIILDQFEEYFLYHPQGDAFAIEFAQAVTLSQIPVSFLISIREDSLSKLDRFEKGIPSIFDNFLRLEHLDREAAQAAIVKPLDHYNALHAPGGADKIDIEPQLIEEILNQVKTGEVSLGEMGRGGKKLSDAEERIETPFLQMVMTRLWNKEMEQGSNLLRLQTLTDLGNASRIIRSHLDEAMGNLTPDEQEIAASIFHQLVTPSGSKIAHSARDLFHYTGLPQKQTQPVLNKLSSGAARILQPVASPSDPQAPPHYEIYHDVLAAAILDWRIRFMQAQKWTRSAEEMRLEQRRVTQWRIGLIAILTLVFTLLVSVYATYRARKEANTALSRELAAVATKTSSTDPELAVLLALTAVEMEPTDEAIKSLRESLLEYPLLAVMETEYKVRHASFSPDGRVLLTGGLEQTARLWDATGGKRLKSCIGQSGQLSTAIFSPDGTLFATATMNDNPTVQIWETNSDCSRALSELKGGHTDQIKEVAFSQDSRLIVTASADRTARVWEARTGQIMGLPLSHDKEVWDANFSQDGTLIATACADGNAYIWETDGGRLLKVLKGHGSVVFEAAFSPDGHQIVTASFDMTARVWNLESEEGEAERTLKHNHSVYSATFSLDGRFVYTRDAVFNIYKWDATTRETPTDPGFEVLSRVGSPRFSPDGLLLVSSEASSDAHVWDATTGGLYKTFLGHKQRITDAVFSPNGLNMATASDDGTARIWRVRRSRTAFDFGNAARASFSLDGRFIISGAQVWNFVTGETVGDPLGNSYDIAFSSYSPDGKHILTVNNDQYAAQDRYFAQIWDARSSNPLQKLPGNAFITNAVFSTDGKFIAMVCGDGSMSVRDVSTGQTVAEFRDGSISYDAAFSPDGKQVVAGIEKNKARIWDVQTKQIVRDLDGHTGSVTSVAYSPDGKLIVTGSDDQKAMVWDAQTGKRKAELQGHTGGLKSAAFSPEGRLIMTVSFDGTARVWQWPSPESLSPVVLESPAGQIAGATFSPDGMFILTTRVGGGANVYERESFLPLNELKAVAKARLFHRKLTCNEWKKYLHKPTCIL